LTPAPDERPSLYTSAMVKHHTARHIHKLLSMGAFKPGFDNHEALRSFHEKTVQFISTLPPAMRPDHPDTSWDLQCPDIVKHRLQISIVVNSFLLALHKPHAARQPQSLELAVLAAIAVLDATQNLFQLTHSHQYKIYTLVFYTIDAGLLLSAMLAKSSSGLENFRARAIESLRQAVGRLKVLKQSVRAAVAGEKALNHCLERLGQKHGQSPPGQRVIATYRSDSDRHYSQAAEDSILSTPEDMLAGAGSTVSMGRAMGKTSHDFSRPESVFDQWKRGGPDYFSQIMDDDAWTATWLEQMNGIAGMEFEFDQELDWDGGISTALTTPQIF
jgi:hypothetical protein